MKNEDWFNPKKVDQMKNSAFKDGMWRENDVGLFSDWFSFSKEKGREREYTMLGKQQLSKTNLEDKD